MAVNLHAVTIREATPADAAPMLAHVRALAAEPDVDVPLSPGEFTVTLKDEERILADYAKSENRAFFTAWRGERLLGMLNLQSNPLPAGRHRATLGMSVERPSRGCGVGRRLLEHAVAWARDNPILTRLELDVYVRNAPARHLYDSMGFVRECRRRAPIWEREQPVDTWLMGLCFEGKAPVPYDVTHTPYTPPRPAPADAAVEVRAATEADAPALHDLWQSLRHDPSLLLPTAGMPGLGDPDHVRSSLVATLGRENGHALVATSGGRVVGTVSAQGHSRSQMRREALVAIAVADGWRGRGIGRALLERLEAEARAGGVLRRMMLFVYADNEPALNLYESCGYEREGLRKAAWFQHGRYHDEYMMALLLT